MIKPQTSLIGSPESYGVQLTSPEAVTEWINTTPEETDPRINMSDEEISLFNAAITPIDSLHINEQLVYFSLIRNGHNLQNVREVAGYDSL